MENSFPPNRGTHHPWFLFKTVHLEPSSSVTPPMVKRGRIQKKQVKGSKLGEVFRPKQSTVVPDSRTLERAKEIQENLSNEFPSFIKCMSRSHVSVGFWLHLPSHLCKMHLPKDDAIVVLEDENGRQYDMKYLSRSSGLSGGWRRFSLDHKLIEGDVLVFHLIAPAKFKVYIIRSQESNEADDAHDHPHLDRCPSQQHDSPLPQENLPSNSPMIRDTSIPPLDQPENATDRDQDFCTEVLDNGIRSEAIISFQQVKGIENFRIVINGTLLDSQLSKHVKTKYYELCFSQRMFLHEQLECQNCELVLGMICEVVNIAEAIRGSKITASPNIFDSWCRSLKGLEILGMNVSFLLGKIEKLMSLASRFKRYEEARIKRDRDRDRGQEDKKILELKLVEVKETINRLNGEFAYLNHEFLELETHFKDMVALW